MRGRASIRKAHGPYGCGTTRWIAPYPSCLRQGWRFWSFRFVVLAGRKFRLDAFDEPLNVGVMLINNQQGRGHSSKNNDGWRSVMRCPQKINEQRHCGGGGDGTQRYIFPPGGHQCKEGQRRNRRRSA